MKINEVIDYLDARFHPEYQEDYDNAGFLVGDGGVECSGVLVALDLTGAVVDEAVALGFNLVVTHHPFIFGGLKSVTDRSEAGRLTLAMVRAGIATYAAHTNLDNLPDGVSGALATRLGLRRCRVLHPGGALPPLYAPLGDTPADALPPHIGAGIVGDLPEAMAADDFLAMVKDVLALPVVRHSDVGTLARRSIRRVALCGGAGAEFLPDALHAHADAYLTADLKYHDFQRPEGRLLLADIGHYESEQFAKEIIYRAISEKFSNFACRISECQQSVVHYI